jgi:phage tail-like protein
VVTYPVLALEHAYRVYIGGGDKYLGTFLEVTGIAVDYEVHEYSEGGINDFTRKLRGRMRQSNLTLKSGVTNQKVLLQWVLGQGELGKTPQDLQVVFVTPAGEILRSFGFAHAVPVRWTGPNANISANQVATESLEIAHQGITPG